MPSAKSWISRAGRRLSELLSLDRGMRIPVYRAVEDGHEIVGFTTVDAADYERLARYRWTLTHNGYPQARMDGAPIHMHRAILAGVTSEIDHVDRDKLNNRRSNLRACTHAENMRNQGPRPGSASRYKGVYRFRGTRWAAKIQVHRKQTYLGIYNREEDAARAYDRAAARHHGEFAYLNFPDEVRSRGSDSRPFAPETRHLLDAGRWSL